MDANALESARQSVERELRITTWQLGQPLFTGLPAKSTP